MIRHARMTMTDETLDELHALKRKLARERGCKVTIDDLLNEGVELLRQHYEVAGIATNRG